MEAAGNAEVNQAREEVKGVNKLLEEKKKKLTEIEQQMVKMDAHGAFGLEDEIKKVLETFCFMKKN